MAPGRIEIVSDVGSGQVCSVRLDLREEGGGDMDHGRGVQEGVRRRNEGSNGRKGK